MLIITIFYVAPGRIHDVCLCASDKVIYRCCTHVSERDHNHVFPMDDTVKFVLYPTTFL